VSTEVQNPDSPAPAPLPAWQRLWRSPAFKGAFYEVLGLALLRARGLQMLNCGYVEDAYPRFLLPPECEAERPGFNLYHRLVRDVPLAGRDALEIGCGRGAGASFLTELHRPRSYLATDASRTLVSSARRLSRKCGPALTFRRISAGALPFDRSFDLCLAVETISIVPDREAFLGQLTRVLRPGGMLVAADFFYTRPDSPNAADRFREAVARSFLRVEREEDWTPFAIGAIEAMSPRRLDLIDRLPRFLRGPALAFAGTTRSPLYRQFKDGRARYLHFHVSHR
jgi:SAM-dependent methyltransferase